MNRKSFLNLTTRAGIFLGLTPLVAKGNTEHAIESEILKDILGSRTAKGTALGLKAEPISNVRIGM
ncbi:MAG: hypothetical protein ACJAZG_002040, partial [Granulosicoccus sp.]